MHLLFMLSLKSKTSTPAGYLNALYLSTFQLQVTHYTYSTAFTPALKECLEHSTWQTSRLCTSSRDATGRKIHTPHPSKWLVLKDLKFTSRLRFFSWSSGMWCCVVLW